MTEEEVRAEILRRSVPVWLTMIMFAMQIITMMFVLLIYKEILQ